jgi:hypothetical protein
MNGYTPDFSLDVQGVKGFCPAGEAYAQRHIEAKTTPVFRARDPVSAEGSPDWRPTWWRRKCQHSLAPVMRRRSSCLIRRWQLGS